MAEVLRSNDDLLHEIGERQLAQTELEKKIKELEKRLDERAPEAIYSITIDKNGGVMITVRSRPGESGDSFLARLVQMREKVEKLGFNMRPQAQPQQPTQPTTAPGGNDESGSVRAVLVKVGESYTGNKPQLQFECDGLEHPLTFTKSVEDMQKLLAPIRKFTVQELAVGKKYAIECMVDWELGKPNKDGKQYRNIIGLRPMN